MPYLNKLDDFCWTMDITPYKLADRISMSRQTLYNYLKDPTIISLNVLNSIADSYGGIEANYLLEYVPPAQLKKRLKQKRKVYLERKSQRLLQEKNTPNQ